MENLPYQQAVGSIMFAAQVLRPDLSFAVSTVSRYNQNPRRAHWTAVKRIFRYLKGTAGVKLVYTAGAGIVSGFCDADWASDADERRSVTGYTFLLQNGAISWSTKKQPTVAIFSTEAVYMALTSAIQEAMWLSSLQKELIPNSPDSTAIRCDNKSAISLALTSTYHARTKYIDVKHHFIREKINEGRIILEYIGTENMAADVMTKCLPAPKHITCSEALVLKFSKI